MRKAITVNPTEWTGHFGLASALRAQGRIEEAISVFENALKMSPGNLHCLAQLSDCTLSRKLPVEAEGYARRAVAANENVPVAWTNLGVALVAQDRFEEATVAFERAEALAQEAGEGSDEHLNLAMCLRDTGRLREALELYERKLPTLPSVGLHTQYAHALLTAGNLLEGWFQYEFRWLQAPLLGLRPSFRKPLWSGQDLRGRTILLRTEQGIGDVIQFIRYAPHVKALGATVLLQVRPGVGELAQSFHGIDRILDASDAYPEFDFHIHLMSLPRVFGTEIASVPADVPYLDVAPSRRARWAKRLDVAGRFKVGLVWAGDAGHLRDRYRSVPLDAFAPLADVDGVQFFLLQKGAAAAQAANPPAGLRVIDLGPDLHDFADTAAVIEQLDLTICVDTSVAHLAGALGKPVWLLLPTPAEWRWMAGREDSPWYPTMRLFRQERQGDWAGVMARVHDALERESRSMSTASPPLMPNAPSAGAKPIRNLPPIDARGRSWRGLSAATETAMGIVQYFPEQPLIGDSIGWCGEYLRHQTDLLMRLIKPGATIMEVGSGVGMHVLALAPSVGTGGFFLYEPRPLFQQVLRQNLAASRIGNAVIMKRSLTTETIDELHLDALDWLKISEESDAFGVLAGAAETLWRLRPRLFIAATDERDVRNIADCARDYGYQCWKVETPYFNRANFNRREIDIFSGRVAHAVLAVPEEIGCDVAFPGCERLA